jgi:diacylglycerol O-acyltransferase
MKQLSGTDAMFLQFEHGNNFMHVASLAIYDPSTAPDGGVRFKDVLRFFASRLEQFPQFRRRLVTVPLALDRPYWVEDPSFDVEFHVRHIALPHPGDWRQLCIQVARLHSRPLDRSKPLWEAYVIEGLHNVPGAPPNSFAVYCKMHHAIVESGTELLKAMHSLSPEPMNLGEEDSGTVYGTPHEPRLPELYSLAVVHNLERIPSLARLSFNTTRRLAGLGAGAFGSIVSFGTQLVPKLRTLLSGDLSPLLEKLPPQTRFSGKVSAHRVFEAVGLPLADFKPIRARVEGATLNDLFLAIVGGALNRYLGSKGELPDSSMVAMVPISLRGADKGGDRGNQVGFTLMPVYSDVADPLERLAAIRDSAQTAKRMADAVGKELARDLLEYLPAPISEAMMRNARLPGIGLTVSNVRGPDVPLYMAGARLVNYSPVSIAVDGLGLNVTGFSYAGTMWICAISCREMLPDPAFFAECLRSGFAELKDAAERAAAAAGRETPAEERDASVAPPRRKPRRKRATPGVAAKETAPARRRKARQSATGA